MISEFSPYSKSDTNSPTTEDRHLFVLKSLVFKDWDWTAGNILWLSSAYTFWAGKPLRTKTTISLSQEWLRASAVILYVIKSKRNERRCPYRKSENYEQEPTAHGFVQGVQKLLQASRTGWRDPQPLLPRARAHLYSTYLTLAALRHLFLRRCLALLYSSILGKEPFVVPLHVQCRKRKGSPGLRLPSLQACFKYKFSSSVWFGAHGPRISSSAAVILSESFHWAASAFSLRSVPCLPDSTSMARENGYPLGAAVIRYPPAFKAKAVLTLLLGCCSSQQHLYNHFHQKKGHQTK